jgi:hypothetical protein
MAESGWSEFIESVGSYSGQNTGKKVCQYQGKLTNHNEHEQA